MAAPPSTYRLQIRQRFTLSAAADLAGYLRELGTGAMYLSPLLQATAGSDHGYDITSHSRVDPERGGEPGRLAAVAAARAHQLQVVVDIVPNHMGVAVPAENEAWWQLLQHGPDSEYAEWFDVDWRAGDGTVLLPVLGDDFSDDQLTVVDGELRYFEHRFPIAPGSHAEGDAPAAVHQRQHYRLVGYRLADTEQNYRRFFAVTDLAGIRVENQPVYRASHAEILRWVQTGTVDGIRIDHPDGLADPAGYLRRLAEDAPDAWITVEKITEPGERLPADWPVAGTTGYDALAEVNTLLYDPAAADAATAAYQRLTGDERSWPEHLERGKRLIATTILLAELRRIARAVEHARPGIAPADELVAALTELAVAFGVYRSYQPAGDERLADAVAVVTGRRPELAGTIAALRPLLANGDREVTVRFEQATGAIMAKGCEDTAYYRYNRAIGLNEVGGDPAGFGCTVAGFHAAQAERQRLLPRSMTTLSTHDTKRSEDVRARLAVLPELGERWYGTAARLLEACPVGNRAFGYLLWQTFAGAGWIERDRMHAYAEKAMREAADGTGWRNPDQAFEQGVHAAVDRAYDDERVHAELDSLIRLVEPYGWSNSLAGKLVQLTMPGVPDVYQGTELYDYSLVDPDNRRDVDFEQRRELLAGLGKPDARPPAVDGTGAAKLWLVHRALTVRRERPELLAGYRPLPATGPAAEHLVAFDRGAGDRPGLLTAVTRLPFTLEDTGGWRDTELALPAGAFTDLLTGATWSGGVPAAELFGRYPVALLTPA
ncbi:MAG TPA: malto-oligosyltrehalose synthase [Jatrophihabitans sp.]|nr:malto-oligosyltrehalose synthase [Jatrophihabitans sp.]